MKYNGRISTAQYEFIEFETEGSPEEAVMALRDLKRAYEGGSGLGMKEFAKVLVEYIQTGGIVDGGNYEFSSNEQILIHEVKKLLRSQK